ncbi:MAG TPA: PA14 domain-containing protein, partial [Candidatus Saccharimonadales bacterium]|nr:PA14 domain-containing protein [Candidatus Saccharimonadales bacterium]
MDLLLTRSWYYFSIVAVKFSKALYKNRQRITALFLVTLIIFGVSSSTASALAANLGPDSSDITKNADNNKNPHKTSNKPSIGKINTKSVPAPAVGLKSDKPAAADANDPVNGNAAAFIGKLTGKASDPVISPASTSSDKPTFTPHELLDKRTATSSSYQNADGTITKKNYFSPHYYQNNGSWEPIDNTLVTDDNAADSGNILGQALGAVESFVSTPDTFKTKANGWQARFAPSDFKDGMVRVKQGNSQVGFSPVNANTVSPYVTTNKNGQQTAHYDNLWSGVNVEYLVESAQVKEAIVLKDKNSASQVQFKMIGADLQKSSQISSPDNVQPAYIIKGALNDKFSISPANVTLNNYGLADNTTSGLSQNYDNGTLSVGVDSDYLKNLPDKAFPVVIDPTIQGNFGTRGEGNYISFDNQGTNCYSNTCQLQVGGHYDTNSVFHAWRGAFFTPYDMFKNSGVSLTSAVMTLNRASGLAWWTGDANSYSFQAGKATCLTGYACMDSTWDTATINTTGTINITNIYASYISGNLYGRWIMLAGDDGTQSSFKAFDPTNSYVTFTYATNLPPPTFLTPQNGTVFTDTQASFRLNVSSSSIQCQMQIVDSADGTGQIVNTGGFQNSNNWTVPDGVLQDGSTYYVEAQIKDPSTGYISPWSTPMAFRIDLRKGNDKTQTFDSVGPAKVDLVTGNVETGEASHTTKALGGDLGVNIDYNSTLRSRPGLVGSYWNNGGGSASSPQLQRVDQAVGFNWNSGSPGAPINSTNFGAQWNGYFVAPTTGNYTFGGVNDDSLNISVNGTQLYSSSYCLPGPCFGSSSIYLTAGQVVSFQSNYTQATGGDIAYLYVKGAVNQQIIPTAWFQSGVRQVQNYGLTGKYYSYTDAGTPPTFPSNGTDGLFLTRTDPIINFNWTGSLPTANAPQADFMTRWTGSITVPATGSYAFGTTSDDGSRVTINGTQTYSAWNDQAGVTGYGSAMTLNAGQSYPVIVDYYQHTGNDSMAFMVQALGGAGQVVPSSWLTPQAQVLPSGWNLGIDPDGNVNYTHLTANKNNAILTTSSGDSYDYVWSGTGYVAPTNSYGFLNRNDDGTFTLQDSDGKTYVFDLSGNLSSFTTPADSGHVASLQYTYGLVNGSGPSSVTKIADGLNSSRYANVYYGGDSHCGSPPSGFSAAPTNMLCTVITNDSRATYFYYDSNGNLAEVLKPGNEATSYQYQSVNNSGGSPIGYQLIGIRDSLANDAIAAGVRANDSTTYTSLQYDTLGRVSSVTAPAATSGATRLAKTIGYNTTFWQSPTDVNDTTASGASPVSVSMGGTVPYLFARGSANDLVYKSWNGTSWTSWQHIAACLMGDPSVASWGANRLDVFVEGCNGTGVNLFHIAYDGTWHSWETIGTPRISSAPSVVAWGSNRLDIFAKAASGNTLYHNYWSGSAWGTAGDNEGGCITGAPVATSRVVNTLDIFAQHCSGSGNNLDQITYNGTAWQSWASVPLHVDNTPSVASLNSSQIDVVSTDSNSHVQQATWTSGGGWTGWSQLGLCSSTRPSLSARSITTSSYDLFAGSCQPSNSDVMWQVNSQPINTTVEHISGATEPASYSERVEYDNMFRTTKVFDNQGLSSTTEWDPVKDLVYSTTDAKGLMSTNIYNDDDQLVSQYGPAPVSWYNRWAWTIPNNTTLAKGSSLWSPDHRYELRFQTDGNVVLYDGATAKWSTNTGGQADTTFIVQTDGNLVLYNNSTAIWNTGTGGNLGAGPSTYLVVQNDCNVVLYNNTGAVWYATQGGNPPSPTLSTYDTPVTGHVNDIAHTDTSYDGSISGLAVNYFAVSHPSTNNASLTGAPLYQSTNINSDGTITKDWGSTSPIPSYSGAWGFSMTGTMRLPQAHQYFFSYYRDNGARMWIDGKLVIDNWQDNPDSANTSVLADGGFYANAVANSIHTVRIDYYHLTASSDANFSLLTLDTQCSFNCPSTSQIAQYFSPDYGLQTSATSYDNTIGNSTVTTSYGSSPEQGQAASSTVDSSGLNLTASSAYETPGSSFGRLTSQTSPGGSTTSYGYYTATDTADNPCTSGTTESYMQAGMLKTVTTPSPDGGTTSGIVTTSVYDDAGNIVATQTNSDGWDCKTYDSRGRVTEEDVPAFNSHAARTITYNYSVSSSPLVTSVTDSSGTISSTVDLLGRTTSYTDSLGDTTTTSYDTLGRVSGRSGPLGTESYSYDSYSRLTDDVLNGDHLAQPAYDQYGRISSVSYPTSGTLKATPTYDVNTGAQNAVTYNFNSGSSASDTVTRTQSGRINGDTLNSGATNLASSFTYDKADRLTAATIGSNTFSYGFGTQDSSCGSGSNMNANSGKSSNRTTQTINGVTSKYCYNYA